MFETAEMSRITVAAPVSNMEEILRIIADLNCIHIEEYGNFEDGINVGKSITSDESEKSSRLLTKARALQSEINAINTNGPKSRSAAKKLVDSMPENIDAALSNISEIRDCEAEIATLNERVKALAKVEPLGLPLN